MRYKFKLFNSEKEYDAFCEKAGIHPHRCEHSAHDGSYHFRWFYMVERDFSYHQYILGAYEHPDGECCTLADKAHELWKKSRRECLEYMHTPEGREAFKKCHQCYPEDYMMDQEDHFMPKPRWECKGEYSPVFPEYQPPTVNG